MTPRNSRLATQLRTLDNLKSVGLASLIVLVAIGASSVVFGWIAAPITLVLLTISLLVNQNAEWMLRLRRATPLADLNAPRLSQLSRQLARKAGVATPQLYLLPGAEPNAMATSGKERPILALTAGLLRGLSSAELEGVVAHEIAHLRHGDLRWTVFVETAVGTSTQLLRVAAWMSFLLALLTGNGWSSWLLVGFLSVVVPTALRLMQLSLSRTREFAADTLAAELTGNPLALASALERIENWGRHRFGWLWARRGLQMDNTPLWLRSHPPTQERIDRLVELGGRYSIRRSRPSPTSAFQDAPPYVLIQSFPL